MLLTDPGGGSFKNTVKRCRGLRSRNMLDDYLTFGDQKLEIRYVNGEQEFAEETFASLSKASRHLIRYFRLSESFPKVRAVLVPNRNEYDRLVRDLLGVEIEVPSDPTRIAQPQRTDMVVLSPSAYDRDSAFNYVPGDFRRLLAHELVHVFEEHLSPDMEATPRWWSEGLAVYLSGQWHHEDDFRQPVIEGVERNRIPRISEIQKVRKLAYQWGWTIVQFVESTYGRELIRRIVKECAGPDVFSMIGEETDILERRWRDWLIYGGPGIE
jgi:hypothetical protein